MDISINICEFMEKTTLNLSSEHDLNSVQSVLFNVRNTGLHRKQMLKNMSGDYKPLPQAVAISTKLGKETHIL